MKYALPTLSATVGVALLVIGVLAWRLNVAHDNYATARSDEADARQMCETRVEESARAASEAARVTLQQAHARQMAALEAETSRALRAADNLRMGLEAIADDRDEKDTQLREALANTVDDCAARIVPASLLDRVRPH